MRQMVLSTEKVQQSHVKHCIAVMLTCEAVVAESTLILQQPPPKQNTDTASSLRACREEI